MKDQAVMPQAEQHTGRMDRGDGVELAWAELPGRAPTVVFLPGFDSDMAGTKGAELAGFCAASGQAMLRLDYSGHGASGGEFIDGTIGRWTEDALAVIDHCSEGPLLLVGSSMGGWIALLAALARPARVEGLVGIAAAPDFTERLMWEAMTFDERATLMQVGELTVPNRYGDPYRVTRRLIEDGRRHLLLGRPIALHCPVRLLHGQRDKDVPWEMSMRLADALESDNVQVTLIKDGDHRLSRVKDLDLLVRTIGALLSPKNGE
jgi:pimeloyl-ACP methyl ester carboxylesterase